MTKEQEVERGRRAAELLENDIFAAALVELESAYIREWQNTAATDTQGRERLYVALQVSKDFAQNLRAMIASGKISAQALQKLRTPR
jgi:hypothetical protein